MLNTLLSNCTFDGQRLCPIYNELLCWIAEGPGRSDWIPKAGNCKNFVEQFTFCPEGLKRREKCDVGEPQERHYRHPLALAYEFQELLKDGVVNTRAEIARRYGLSRARVTQVMKLLHLPDEIQEHVMALPSWEQRLYSGRRMGKIAALANEQTRGDAFEELQNETR